MVKAMEDDYERYMKPVEVMRQEAKESVEAIEKKFADYVFKKAIDEAGH